jgi:hypothetical protein
MAVETSIGPREPAAGEGGLRIRVETAGGGGPGYEVTTPHPAALIGRHAAADVFLSDESIHSRHASVHAVGGRVFWAELGRRPAAPSGWLAPGQLVPVGPYLISVVSWPEGDEWPAEVTDPLKRWDPGLAPDPPVTFEISGDECEPRDWMMNRPLVLVGSSVPCKLRLLLPSVSRVHCSLLHTPRGVHLTDLCGRGGVSVNAEPVRFAHLKDGDLVRIGTLQARLCDARSRRPARGRDRAHPPGRALTVPFPGPSSRPDESDPHRRLALLLSGRDGPGAMPLGQVAAPEVGHLLSRLIDITLASASMGGMNQVLDELTLIRRLLEQHCLSVEATRAAAGQPREKRALPRPVRGTLAPVDAAGRLPRAGEDQGPDLSAEEMHSILSERIASIDWDHRSAWRKLLGRVMGA